MPVAASAASPDDLRDGQSAPLRGLVLVSTPIGNLGDMSARARAVLADCDLILCEDTPSHRATAGGDGIHARTEALHEHNEDARIASVLAASAGRPDDRPGFRRGNAAGVGSRLPAGARGDRSRACR